MERQLHDAFLGKVRFDGCINNTAWHLNQFIEDAVYRSAAPAKEGLLPVTIDIPHNTEYDGPTCIAFIQIEDPLRVIEFSRLLNGKYFRRQSVNCSRAKHPSRHHNSATKTFAWSYRDGARCTIGTECLVCPPPAPANLVQVVAQPIITRVETTTAPTNQPLPVAQATPPSSITITVPANKPTPNNPITSPAAPKQISPPAASKAHLTITPPPAQKTPKTPNSKTPLRVITFNIPVPTSSAKRALCFMSESCSPSTSNDVDTSLFSPQLSSPQLISKQKSPKSKRQIQEVDLSEDDEFESPNDRKMAKITIEYS